MIHDYFILSDIDSGCYYKEPEDSILKHPKCLNIVA